MIIRMCAFTHKGFETVKTIQEKMPKHLIEIRNNSTDLKEWTEESFKMKAPLVFVGAVGIAVRLIVPFVEDKLSDSPVIVIDENGSFVIPILSGHVGGANRLSEELAKVLNATPVITTATDINGLFSVDVFAVNNGLQILNRSGIREVSSKLLREKEITMAVGDGIAVDAESLPKEVRLVPAGGNVTADVFVTKENTLQNAILTLVAKQYVLGVGCKKETGYEVINEAVTKVLEQNSISPEEISRMASIDLKEKERGLLVFSSINHMPFLTYSSQELEALKGEFSQSEFVRSVTGVSNVCERAAMAAAGTDAELIVTKQALNGVTVALAKRKVVLHG